MKGWTLLVTLGLLTAGRLPTVQGQECFSNEGGGCFFLCNCDDAVECDRTTGVCQNGCMGSPQPYKGPGSTCQIGNVAYRKRAEQSGTLQNGADLAVDGSTEQMLVPNLECATPFSTDGSPAYWTVDLGEEHAIENITVLDRNNNGNEEMFDWNVAVIAKKDIATFKQTPCTSVEFNDPRYQPASRKFVLSCDKPTTAQFVTIQKKAGTANSGRLTLCEVIINGYRTKECPKMKWGPGCLYDCHCDQPCDQAFGQCPGSCLAGWTGPSCQEACPQKTWGPRCLNNCNCNQPCNKESGQCSGSCLAGWTGTSCQEVAPKKKKNSFRLECFSAHSTVTLETGETKSVRQLTNGDRVMSVSSDGATVFSDVIMMLHADPHLETDFLVIKTEQEGIELKITEEHLLYTTALAEDVPRYRKASRVQVGDSVYTTTEDGLLKPSLVTAVDHIQDVGAFAPLTYEGTIVVDGVAASSYAYMESQTICHALFWPVRVLHEWLPALFFRDNSNIHWYADFIKSTSTSIIPEWVWPEKEFLL